MLSIKNHGFLQLHRLKQQEMSDMQQPCANLDIQLFIIGDLLRRNWSFIKSILILMLPHADQRERIIVTNGLKQILKSVSTTQSVSPVVWSLIASFNLQQEYVDAARDALRKFVRFLPHLLISFHLFSVLHRSTIITLCRSKQESLCLAREKMFLS